MGFKEKILKGEFVVTSEIGPPKGVDVKEIFEDAKLLKNKVDAINVTDLQSSVMRVGSLAICHLLKDIGIDPIYQLTCRDRNRLALQSDLLSAYILGIRNVLALTGDYPTLGDHPETKPVFDLDAVTLLDAIGKLNKGIDLAGKELKGKPDFFAGAVVNPGADPLEPEIIKMEKKIQVGAKFFQTQAVYDISLYEKFLNEAKRFKIPILAGIVLLKSAGMAKYMNKNVAGVNVGDNLRKEMQ
ncbi:MAG: methylenetetrahydrofolate reductase, partial [Candidatus Omnitrophica bacterium]|nr:methylenetetrahydrofolate reductase [Candidatus Omnitrophota bacterium]